MRTFSIGGGLAGPPSACSSDPDRVDVFAVGAGATVWHWSTSRSELACCS